MKRPASVSKSSDAKLATQLARMLAGGTMIYPNPVETQIEKQKRLFIEDKDHLFVLSSAAGRSAAELENSVLKKLQHAQSIKKMYLYPVPGWDDRDPAFDFANFCKLVSKYLPKVSELFVQHMSVKNFELKAWPKLSKLTLIGPQCEDLKWSLQLENLEELVMENHSPPEKCFANSLLHCPRIRMFFAHKYWADGALPSLYLPNCTDFTFRRGDCVDRLTLYLPRVKELNLDANYDLRVLKFLKQGHASQAEWNLPTQAKQSKFSFSCQNALLGKQAREELLGSGRLLNRREAERDVSMDEMDTDMEDEEEDEDDFDTLMVGNHLLGRQVRVMHLKSRKDLVGKEGKITEVYPDKNRIGVWFLHTKTLELSLPFPSVEILRIKPPKKRLKAVN